MSSFFDDLPKNAQSCIDANCFLGYSAKKVLISDLKLDYGYSNRFELRNTHRNILSSKLHTNKI